MKTVRLFKTGKLAKYDDSSADWLVMKGYAEPIPETKQTAAPKQAPKQAEEEQAAPAAPRRGRPPKAR
jgi:hypothetical protein